MSGILDMGQAWWIDNGVRVLIALLALVGAWAGSAWLKRAVIRGLERTHFDLTLAKFFASTARWLFLVLIGLAMLSAFGVETTGFAAILAASGVAIGLAFQGTLSSFAAGVVLLVLRPFKVGDSIRAAGEAGIVDEISLFNTRLDTFDNRRIFIPNADVLGGNIENISHHPRRRADVPVGTAYDADIDRTREVLEIAAASVDGHLDDPAPQVVLTGLGGSSIDWEVRVWASASELMSVKQSTIRAVKLALDEAGIGIPFPQLDVHMEKQ